MKVKGESVRPRVVKEFLKGMCRLELDLVKAGIVLRREGKRDGISRK